MSQEDVLVMPRNLAIRILHEAQIAQPEAIRGRVWSRDAQPAGFMLGDSLPEGRTPWARLWSQPLAPAVPGVQELREGELSLVISLNTKGVLEMRAWRLHQGAAQEQVLKIRD